MGVYVLQDGVYIYPYGFVNKKYSRMQISAGLRAEAEKISGESEDS